MKQEEEGFIVGLRPCLIILHKVSDAIKALQLRWISLHEKDSINAEAFLIVRTSGSIAWQECGPQWFCRDRSRSLYEAFDFPSSIIF